MAFDKAVDSSALEANLTSVADAIRNRGGTEEKLSFPNGFVSAVNNIPTVVLKRATGTFRHRIGEATVDVGFKPDIVLVTGLTDTADGEVYEYQLAAVFPEKQSNGDNSYLASVGITSAYPDGMELGFQQTDTGFYCYAGRYGVEDGQWVWKAYISNVDFNFVAIKYTE